MNWKTFLRSCRVFLFITVRQQSWGKVMFLQVSVILFGGGWGEVILGTRSLPGGGYPWSHVLSGGISGTRSLPGMGMPGPRSLLGELGMSMGWGYVWGWVCGYPPPWYRHLVVATEAGSTHPTGMLSCSSQFFYLPPGKFWNQEKNSPWTRV